MSTCAVRATGHLRPPGTPPSPEHATPPPPPVPGAPTALPYARLFGLTTATYGAYQALSWATAQLVDLFSLELDQDPEAASTLAGLCHHLAFIMEHIKLLRVHGREHELMQALVERRAAEDADHENQYSLMQRVVETSGTWLLTTVRVAGLWAGVRALSGAACCPEAFMTQTFVLCGDWLALDVRWVPTYVTNTATIVHVLDTSANIERDGGLAPALFRGKVEFRDVHFAYPARPDIEVLKGVTCTIDPGQRVAFVGPSGCGKSTCVCLLQRLYEPTAGQILLDDIPIERYGRAAGGPVCPPDTPWDDLALLLDLGGGKMGPRATSHPFFMSTGGVHRQRPTRDLLLCMPRSDGAVWHRSSPSLPLSLPLSVCLGVHRAGGGVAGCPSVHGPVPRPPAGHAVRHCWLCGKGGGAGPCTPLPCHTTSRGGGGAGPCVGPCTPECPGQAVELENGHPSPEFLGHHT